MRSKNKNTKCNVFLRIPVEETESKIGLVIKVIQIWVVLYCIFSDCATSKAGIIETRNGKTGMEIGLIFFFGEFGIWKPSFVFC